jgi:CheY-like chemotaxis protein
MKPRLRILLIEDNDGDIELAERAIECAKLPCDLTSAHNGRDALKLLHSLQPAQWPDAILLDINMPVMDGKKFLEEVKAERELQLIPVVMLTSSSAPADICDCYARHASAYFVKPFDANAYAALIRQILAYWTDAVRPPSPRPERSKPHD